MEESLEARTKRKKHKQKTMHGEIYPMHCLTRSVHRNFYGLTCMYERCNAIVLLNGIHNLSNVFSLWVVFTGDPPQRIAIFYHIHFYCMWYYNGAARSTKSKPAARYERKKKTCENYCSSHVFTISLKCGFGSFKYRRSTPHSLFVKRFPGRAIKIRRRPTYL